MKNINDITDMKKQIAQEKAAGEIPDDDTGEDDGQ